MDGPCTKCSTLNTWSFLSSHALLADPLACEKFGRVPSLRSSSSVSVSSSSAVPGEISLLCSPPSPLDCLRFLSCLEDSLQTQSNFNQAKVSGPYTAFFLGHKWLDNVLLKRKNIQEYICEFTVLVHISCFFKWDVSWLSIKYLFIVGSLAK